MKPVRIVRDALFILVGFAFATIWLIIFEGPRHE